MRLIDTHCHIHESSYSLDREQVIKDAAAVGVTKIICVGTDIESSKQAADFAVEHDSVWVIVGVHPHEASHGIDQLAELAKKPKVVGIGEIGLDYYYNHSPRDVQIEMLNRQIELALRNDLPISFHVRDAFNDFWPIFDNFHGIRGVLHSFTDSIHNMEIGLGKGLFFGVNGIATFNKDPDQSLMYQAIPLERMVLETDAPFLAPKPFRGQTNQPSRIMKIAEFLAELRNEDLDTIANITTANAESVFVINL